LVTDCAPRPPAVPLGDGAAAALVAGLVEPELELEFELQPAIARAATARAAIPA
jgi:hypothetical protein